MNRGTLLTFSAVTLHITDFISGVVMLPFSTNTIYWCSADLCSLVSQAIAVWLISPGGRVAAGFLIVSQEGKPQPCFQRSRDNAEGACGWCMAAWSHLLPPLSPLHRSLPRPPAPTPARPHRAGRPVDAMQLHLSVTSFFLWTLADGIPGRTAQVGTAVPPGACSRVLQSHSAQWSAAWG